MTDSMANLNLIEVISAIIYIGLLQTNKVLKLLILKTQI
jgi:hypothetical protein